MARRRKPTVWEALNEPIIEVTEEQAKNVFLAAIVIVFGAWVAPYWGQTSTTVYYAPENVFEQFANSGEGTGVVAGASTSPSSSPYQGEERGEVAPEWYYVIEEMPNAVVQSFTMGADEVLDISGPVTEMTEFYQPGADAVWNAWLDLMADP